MESTVRKFTDADAARVAVIMHESFRAVFGELAGDIETPEYWQRLSESPDKAAWVAVIGGEVAGYLLVTADGKHGLGTLDVIGVDPGIFSKGVGSLLYAEADKFWRERKMRKIWTCVSAINPRAIAFYKKQGFGEEGVQRSHFFDGVDEILLAKFLT